MPGSSAEPEASEFTRCPRCRGTWDRIVGLDRPEVETALEQFRADTVAAGMKLLRETTQASLRSAKAFAIHRATVNGHCHRCDTKLPTGVVAAICHQCESYNYLLSR